MDTTIILTCIDPKQSFDEISLKRVSVMAHQSLNPEEFEAFISVHNKLIERRKLQNNPII